MVAIAEQGDFSTPRYISGVGTFVPRKLSGESPDSKARVDSQYGVLWPSCGDIGDYDQE